MNGKDGWMDRMDGRTDGMEWNGMEWNGMEWNGMGRRLMMSEALLPIWELCIPWLSLLTC